ncbi:hypothetical protein, conserved [Eimeria tenella]|uniref:Uncharacterized protein n=1 Tax=Eimeria tenella TaxID=5802 RepID=U6KNR8_EIMTE|nr:hypothetical protein, conserved [Eimeria tenella]CDJ37098.1 hypothetical protein, conserved [Eimeria tenella]|eukprot:XP_013227936.1 hypothetical protein, conserved [Eimeria tenella]
MLGTSIDSPQRVRPAQLRRSKPQQQQQQQRRLPPKQQQHALFVQTRKQAAEAAAAAVASSASGVRGLLNRSDSAVSATSGATATSGVAKRGKLVAVTTYSGTLDDYLLLHSTDGSSNGSSSSCAASPLRGSSEEELRGSSIPWNPKQLQQAQQVNERDSRQVSDSCNEGAKQQQQVEASSRESSDTQQQQQPSTRSQSHNDEEEQQEHEQQQQQTSSSKDGGRLIVPPAVRTPEGGERRHWPSMTLSLLPHLSDLHEFPRIATFAQNASELKKLAEAPFEAISPAAAALKLQQQQRQQSRQKLPVHWTLADGLRSLCKIKKPEQTSMPPIKLPVYFPNESSPAAGAAEASEAAAERAVQANGTASGCSSNCSRQNSNLEQPSRGSSNSSGSSAEGPFAEKVSVHLKNGGQGRVVAVTPTNNLVVKLQNGTHVEAHPSECRFLIGGMQLPQTQPQLAEQQGQQGLAHEQQQLQQQQQQEGQFKLLPNLRGVETIPTVSELLQKAAAEAGRTHNTVVLSSLASVARVCKTGESLSVLKVTKKTSEGNKEQKEEFQAIFSPENGIEPSVNALEEELSDLPEAVIRPPGICMLTGRKSQVESRQIIKPQTSTYDVVKAPGIVRPLYDIISPASQIPSSLPRSQQQQQPQRQQQQQKQQQQPPSTFIPGTPELAQLTALAGPGGGFAAAAAAELELVGQKWFGDLQQQLSRDMMQQYINTAPPAIGGFSAPSQRSFGPLIFSSSSGNRKAARVIRSETDAITYATPANQQSRFSTNTGELAL